MSGFQNGRATRDRLGLADCTGKRMTYAADGREAMTSHGAFDLKRFSLGRLSELVGQEMQRGGQQSEAGGGK